MKDIIKNIKVFLTIVIFFFAFEENKEYTFLATLSLCLIEIYNLKNKNNI